MIAFTLLAALAVKAESDACTTLTDMRKAAGDNFKEWQGELLKKDSEYKKYKSRKTLSGTKECYIEVDSAKESKYTCEWHTHFGKEKVDEATTAYMDTVKEFWQCDHSKEPLEVEARSHGGISFDFDEPPHRNNPKDRRYVSLTQMWHAPWWYIYFEYKRYEDKE
ncbi:hypothetical protein [Roseateles sp. P5_E4]